MPISAQYTPAAVTHPGYVSGKWYVPATGAVIATGAALSIGSIRMTPIRIEAPVVVSQLGTRITTASAGGNIQLAIYANNPATGKPTGNPLAATGNISTTSTGPVNAAPAGGNVVLPAGIYWFCVNSDNATVVCQALTALGVWTAGLIGSATQANISGAATAYFILVCTKAFNTWPDMTSETIAESISTASAAPQIKVA